MKIDREQLLSYYLATYEELLDSLDRLYLDDKLYVVSEFMDAEQCVLTSLITMAQINYRIKELKSKPFNPVIVRKSIHEC